MSTTTERLASSAPMTGLNQTDIEDREGEPGGIAADRLSSMIDRIERLEEERKALSSDIKDIFAEAKSAAFDVKVMRQVLARRRKKRAEVEEQDTLLDLYERALDR